MLARAMADNNRSVPGLSILINLPWNDYSNELNMVFENLIRQLRSAPASQSKTDEQLLAFEWLFRLASYKEAYETNLVTIIAKDRLLLNAILQLCDKAIARKTSGIGIAPREFGEFAERLKAVSFFTLLIIHSCEVLNEQFNSNDLSFGFKFVYAVTIGIR